MVIRPVRILTRYILKEVLSHGLIGASVFTFVIFMQKVSTILELVVRNSAPVPSVAELFFLTLPTAFTFTIPMGVLVGILIGLSRMAADSEVTAMRAAGVGVLRFVKIVSMFGVVAWLLALANTTLVAPRSAAALERLKGKLASSQASFEVQPRVFYEEFPNYVLYVQDATTASGAVVWKNVFLADISKPDAPTIILAEEAVVTNEANNTIRLHLEKGEQHETNIHSPEQYNISTFNETDMLLNLPAQSKPASEVVPVSQLGTPELLRRTHNPDKELARWYWIEFNRRFALSTACLVLVLIGIPLGLSARKGGKGAGFVLTIVLVFIYYFGSITGVSLARSGKVPPALGVWLANIIFAVIGLVLLWRVDKMPIEIGLGPAAYVQFKRWVQARLTGREDRGNGWLSRQRLFTSTRFPLLLDDYVLRNFVGALLLILASFLVLFLIFTFFELFSDIVRNKIPLLTVGEYLLNYVPAVVYLITPLSVLLAVLITFGLLQKWNEITAMKATGISIYRTLVPVLVISAAIAGGLFLLDKWYVPYTNKRAETLRNTIKGRPAQTYRRPDRKWIVGQEAGVNGKQQTIYYYEFYDPDQDRFASISAFELDPHNFQIAKRVYASRARWEESLQRWELARGWERSFSNDPTNDFRSFEVSTFAEMREQPSYFKKEVHQSSEMNYEELQTYINDLQQSGFDVVRLRVQLQKKLAYPVITFVMAVLAFPFALSAGRRGAVTGVAVALVIAVTYLVVAGLFEALGNVSQLPPALAAWAPDVIFGLAGGYMVLKTPS
ncbi:MAG TPA: LptF/LptG family permease [Verrucomicrobiae bacterium]|jgi:LPS export ABC transporter permease LptG/LPS export ABC transporter permease LptF|nr:LptF/LptG family permease [Verrucomicrobiae bacterium]